MSFAETIVNPGSGGAKLASDTFTQGSDTVTIVYSGIAFGTLGGGGYQAVDGSHGFPVAIVAALPAGANVIGGVTQSGPWSVTVEAGSALIGQVELSDGANVLGTNSHPVRVDPTGTTTQPVSVSGTVAVSGTFWQATQPVSLVSLPALTAGSNLIGQVEVSDGTNVLGTTSHPVRVDPTGTTSQPVSIAGTVAVSGTFWQATQPVSIAGDQAVNVAQVAGTATSVNEGASDAGTTRISIGTDDNFSTDSRWSTADTNLHTVKSSAGRVFRIEMMNTGSGPAYLRLYNKASNPAPASDTPVRRYTIPGSAAGGGFVMEYLKGRYFSTGIAYDITGGAGDTDTTALAANQCVINVDFK